MGVIIPTLHFYGPASLHLEEMAKLRSCQCTVGLKNPHVTAGTMSAFVIDSEVQED